MTEANVLLPVLSPDKVSVVAEPPVKLRLPVLPNVIGPVPEDSIVAPLDPSVMSLSVVLPEPTYCSVPPLITRLEAALELAPTPELARVVICSVPPLMVVPPEYVLVPESTRVPVPVLVRLPLPLLIFP